MKTKILKIDPLDFNEKDLIEVCNVIKSGGLVAFPTETVYGLGASAFEEKAVDNIFKVKGRAKDNPLIVHVDRFEKLLEIAEVAEKYFEAINKLTPGPVTFVLKQKINLPKNVTAGLKTVGVRIPAHPVARKLCKCAGPIAAPSANLSGKPSPTDSQAVIEDLFGKIDFIIDAGNSEFGLESTIIDLTSEIPIVLRPGPITIEQLESIFGKVEIPQFVIDASSVENPKAPGMKYRHYAPEKPVYRFNKVQREKVIKKALSENGVFICPEEHKKFYPDDRIMILGKLSEPYSIAQNLFKVLREFDRSNFNVAFIEAFEEKGILLSVMNRLKKASVEVEL
ncbi:universally conserved protein [Thermosipho africanus H17ap60334]|uniref:Threonylcarbamoyl-AMP synthase n=2 Tax=Thermosipho TaxID=2420 RepID=B7IFU2_THEAB|nr:L-threonylcarbamoyladenylate synthase [Thermosipho africanus]ACJ74956.1 universally conserved protein [Thermosipho africanus TCF52B]EKF48690.1 universally conserved protein [Thermosipho africanus H17ap60334]HCF37656.1 threonylcarbamoyl-AMP synthase [Thermosipho africanus]